MSGQPYRYASDPAKFRDEYMKTLRLQSDINTMNLDANKAFKSTGQLPAVSQMPETRTTSEILADQQKMRMSLMEDLKPLGSPAFASDIVQAIQRSPLNVDGSLFIFFAQRAPEITANVKKQYKFGIKGDKNDVAQFVFFVEDMYNKTKSFAGSVKTYFNRPAESGIGSGTITFGDLDSIKKIYDEVARKLLLNIRDIPIRQGFRGPVGEDSIHTASLKQTIVDISNMISNLAGTLRNADYVANTRLFLDSNTKLIGFPLYTDVIDRYSDLYKRYSETLDNFPKATTLYTLIGKLDDTTKNKNFKLAKQVIELIFEQVQPGLEGFSELNQQLEQSRGELERLLQREQTGALTREQEREELLKEQGRAEIGRRGEQLLGQSERDYEQQRRRADQQQIALRRQQLIDELIRRAEQRDLGQDSDDEIPPPPPRTNFEGLTKVSEEDLEGKPQIQQGRTDADQIRALTTRIIDLDYALNEITDKLNLHKQGTLHDMYTRLLDDNRKEKEGLETELRRLTAKGGAEETKGEKVEGTGIKKRGRGRPRGSGIALRKTFKDSFIKHKDDTMGIDESPRYIKFGKFFINTHKLKGTGMLTLRRQGGGNISEFPSTRVSTNLSDIVFKMVGGGVPTYQELSKLSEPEKAYLHKITTKANIVDKFSIPAPDKDRQEKDIHDFEVMKGEILAGNDSKELIKKFKLHLIKLSKNGTLPKQEVQEIMEELIQLGF